jgi:hypothetical protein
MPGSSNEGSAVIPVVVWLSDAATAPLLTVSIGSLKRNAPDFWGNSLKVVIDFGLGDAHRSWLESMSAEDLLIIPHLFADSDTVVGHKSHRPAQIMRVRVRLTEFVQKLAPSSKLMHCDADTIFFRSPQPAFECFSGVEDIAAVRAWDWASPADSTRLVSWPLDNDVTFASEVTSGAQRLAESLGISYSEFSLADRYNTGVWVSSTESALSKKWNYWYEKLCSIEDQNDDPLLNPHNAEEVALSLGVFFGDILARPLRQRYNYLPPRAPHQWPPETVIGHYVTFGRNFGEPSFATWWAHRRKLLDESVCPPECLAMGGLIPNSNALCGEPSDHAPPT